jgi:integrase/recombinase XerC
LRVSEALALEVAYLDLQGDNPTVRVRQGKSKKPRLVPMYLELAVGLRNFLDYSNTSRGPIFKTSWSPAGRWVQAASEKAVGFDLLPPGNHMGPHTLKHSAARHWLSSGVPLNHVSRCLGHASIQTTLTYLEILPETAGYRDQVPEEWPLL